MNDNKQSKSKIRIYIYVQILLLVIAYTLAFNKGYNIGSGHGFIDGNLHGVNDCLYYMNKLANTLTENTCTKEP